MDLYERIKELSTGQKISIRQLEEKLNYGNGTIGRWKKSNPSIDKVQKVADYFHVSVDYLLGRTNNPVENNTKFADLDDDTVRLAYKGNQISDDDRKKILKIFSLLKDNDTK